MHVPEMALRSRFRQGVIWRFPHCPLCGDGDHLKMSQRWRRKWLSSYGIVVTPESGEASIGKWQGRVEELWSL